MALANLNTDALVCTGATISALDHTKMDLISLTKDDPSVIAQRYVDNEGKELLRIPEISLFVSMSAFECVDDDGDSLEDEREEIFVFGEKYSLLIRLTEPTSGNFVDLDSFSIDTEKSNYKIYDNKRVYNKRILMKTTKIPVSIPEKDNIALIKVLIRKENSQDKWIVQSVHPLKLMYR